MAMSLAAVSLAVANLQITARTNPEAQAQIQRQLREEQQRIQADCAVLNSCRYLTDPCKRLPADLYFYAGSCGTDCSRIRGSCRVQTP